MIKKLIAKLEQDTGSMAHALAWAKLFWMLDDQELMEWLKTDEDGFVRLALCRRPRPHLREQDINTIAEFAGADPATIRQIVEGLEALDLI